MKCWFLEGAGGFDRLTIGYREIPPACLLQFRPKKIDIKRGVFLYQWFDARRQNSAKSYYAHGIGVKGRLD